jgi:cytochrome b6-f complex iron-sulfur subunit
MNNQLLLNRNAFLKNLGLKGAALMAVYCGTQTLSSCVNESDTVSPITTGNELLTIDLSNTVALKSIGGFVQSKNIVVAQVSQGKYVAVPQVCTHEGRKEVIFQSGEFYCTAHGARFDTTGTGLNGNGKKGLKPYTIVVTGSILKVYA